MLSNTIYLTVFVQASLVNVLFIAIAILFILLCIVLQGIFNG